MAESDKRLKRDKNSGAVEKRPKAEPRVTLAPLDFEEAVKGLLAVAPAREDSDDEQGTR